MYSISNLRLDTGNSWWWCWLQQSRGYLYSIRRNNRASVQMLCLRLRQAGAGGLGHV